MSDDDGLPESLSDWGGWIQLEPTGTNSSFEWSAGQDYGGDVINAHAPSLRWGAEYRGADWKLLVGGDGESKQEGTLADATFTVLLIVAPPKLDESGRPTVGAMSFYSTSNTVQVVIRTTRNVLDQALLLAMQGRFPSVNVAFYRNDAVTTRGSPTVWDTEKRHFLDIKDATLNTKLASEGIFMEGSGKTVPDPKDQPLSAGVMAQIIGHVTAELKKLNQSFSIAFWVVIALFVVFLFQGFLGH